jgi:hypothetical protein
MYSNRPWTVAVIVFEKIEADGASVLEALLSEADEQQRKHNG